MTKNLYPTRHDIDILVELHVQKAKKQLLKEGSIPPTGVMVLPTKVYSSWVFDFSSEMQKNHEIQRYVKTLKRNRAVAGIVVSESWLAFRSPNESVDSMISKPVSQRTDRRETICVAVRSWEFQFCVVIPFSRDGKGNPLFESQIIFDEGETRLFGDAFTLSGTKVHGNA